MELAWLSGWCESERDIIRNMESWTRKGRKEKYVWPPVGEWKSTQ
jgi:hypothetical protein